VQVGQQAPGLCVWLANGQSRGAQSTRVQSPLHCPQHSPGGMIGLGQGGLGQSLTLQSSLQVLQQSHRTIGNGQNVSGHSAEPSQGGGGVGRVGIGIGSGTGLTGSSPRLLQVRQHLSSPNTGTWTINFCTSNILAPGSEVCHVHIIDFKSICKMRISCKQEQQQRHEKQSCYLHLASIRCKTDQFLNITVAGYNTSSLGK